MDRGTLEWELERSFTVWAAAERVSNGPLLSVDDTDWVLLLICCIDRIVRTRRTVACITTGFNIVAFRRCRYSVDEIDSKQQRYACRAVAQKPHDEASPASLELSKGGCKMFAIGKGEVRKMLRGLTFGASKSAGSWTTGGSS